MLMKAKIGDYGFDETLIKLLDRYAKQKRSISVDFRKLVTGLTFSVRATHFIHTYPAKLLPHIPYLFLNNSILSQPGSNVLDPFCGSGTVLLESLLAGRNAYGADSNPLARLLTKVKTTAVDIDGLKKSAKQLEMRIYDEPIKSPPNVVNIDYWFYPHVIKQLTAIKEAIDKTRNESFREFYQICFSNCVKKVSLADPRLSVPVRLRGDQYDRDHELREVTEKKLRILKRVNVRKEFLKVLSMNIKRLQSLIDNLPKNVSVLKIMDDARNINSALSSRGKCNSKIDLIVTSPPYAGAQKYIRSSSLNMGWLDMCDANELRYYEDLNIGREHYKKEEYSTKVITGMKRADDMLSKIYKKNPLRAHIAGQYLLEMRDAFSSAVAVLKPNGHIVLIAANNKVCGYDFKTQEYLCAIIESFGCTLILKLVDDIHSRGLMTKRNKTASVISREWVMVFQKNR